MDRSQVKATTHGGNQDSLNLLYIYKKIEIRNGGPISDLIIDPENAMVAISRWFASIDDVAKWVSVYDKRARSNLGGVDSSRTQGWKSVAVDCASSTGSRKKLSNHLSRIWTGKYVAVTSSFIIKLCDARNADIERLDATVWRNAFSYMMINWGTWSQQLHLPEKLRAYFPGGKFGAADVEDQQMVLTRMQRNLERYTKSYELAVGRPPPDVNVSHGQEAIQRSITTETPESQQMHRLEPSDPDAPQIQVHTYYTGAGANVEEKRMKHGLWLSGWKPYEMDEATKISLKNKVTQLPIAEIEKLVKKYRGLHRTAELARGVALTNAARSVDHELQVKSNLKAYLIAESEAQTHTECLLRLENLVGDGAALPLEADLTTMVVSWLESAKTDLHDEMKELLTRYKGTRLATLLAQKVQTTDRVTAQRHSDISETQTRQQKSGTRKKRPATKLRFPTKAGTANQLPEKTPRKSRERKPRQQKPMFSPITIPRTSFLPKWCRNMIDRLWAEKQSASSIVPCAVNEPVGCKDNPNIDLSQIYSEDMLILRRRSEDDEDYDMDFDMPD